MKDNVLLNFEYDNKHYYVELKDKDLIFYYVKNNNVYYDLNKKEIKQIHYILNQLIPSSNTIKLFDYKLDNTNYEILLDKKTNLKLINPISYDTRIIRLLCLLNNQEVLMHSNKSNNKGILKFQRIIKYGRRTLLVMVGFTMLLVATKNGVEYLFNEQAQRSFDKAILAMETNSDLEESEIIQRLENAIDCNAFLSETEKEKVKPIIDVVLDNKGYIDLDYLENNLLTLRIVYKDKEIDRNLFQAGTYDSNNNLITFYNKSDITEVEDYTLNHELCHVITKYDVFSMNVFLIETTNAIFNEEYFGESDHSIYDNYYYFTKILMEIVGSDVLKEYHNYASDKLLINALTSIIADENEAIRLVHNLNNYKTLYDDYINSGYAIEIYASIKEYESTICEELMNYYVAAKGINIDDDIIMQYYFQSPKLSYSLHKCCDLDAEVLITNLEFEKVYFNNEKKNDIILSANSLYPEEQLIDKIYITENTRYLINQDIKK